MPSAFADTFDCQVALRDDQVHVQVMKGPSGKTINRKYGFSFDLPASDEAKEIVGISFNDEQSLASGKMDYRHAELTFSTFGIQIQLWGKGFTAFLMWENDIIPDAYKTIVTGLCEMFYL